MIRGMSPSLAPGRFAFVTHRDVPTAAAILNAVGLFREAEGVSLIVPIGDAHDDHAMREITLGVHSALDGVGLTAAVATALANEGIPANVVAAYHHDHVFVPEDKAERALAALERLSAQS